MQADTVKENTSSPGKKAAMPSKRAKSAPKTTRKRKVRTEPDVGDAERQPAKRTKKATVTPRAKDIAAVADGCGSSWDVTEVLATELDLPLDVSINVTRLLDEENTIPFIARYRKEVTGNMDAARLRQFEEHYESLRAVKTKTAKVLQTITKSGAMTATLLYAVKNARTLDDLDSLYAPFKLNKTSLAERARKLGLDEPASLVLQDPENANISFENYVQRGKKGLETVSEVELGVQHIIAERIAKDYVVIKSVKNIFDTQRLYVECKKNRNVKKLLAESNDAKVYKFEQYFEFRRNVASIHSHQVLAINRGENLKILSVKVEVPQMLVQQFLDATYRQLCGQQSAGPRHANVYSLLQSSIRDCYDRLTEPSVCRRVRAELTKMAEKSSVQVFANNLRNLLLTSAVKGQPILAVDPGFRQGCKVAIVAPNGSVLYTETLYLHDNRWTAAESQKLVENAVRHNCEIIGIGNGTACRETEALVVHLINKDAFHPLKVSYCIVDESGASVYSVSEVAVAEFPTMDPNLRSAVSLARRLVDPMSEYVKVDPKHLGIGMYQHDISEGALKKTLDGVVQECVSFVGLDVNTASQTVLSKVAGLSNSRAASIAKFRTENGAIVNREQLMLVQGIGPKTYVQCAGFLRISPKTMQSAAIVGLDQCPEPGGKKPETKAKKTANVSAVPNYLDSTAIHPEAYEIATRLLQDCECKACQIGTPKFISTIKNYFSKFPVDKCAAKYGVGVETMKLIADGLQQGLDHDIREDFNKPLFRRNVVDLQSIRVGMVLKGKVTNATTFGVFVDVGVGCNGLLPNSKLDRRLLCDSGGELSLGERIHVKVLEVNPDRGRILLSLVLVDNSTSCASLLR